jgi:hypothetical protein
MAIQNKKWFESLQDDYLSPQDRETLSTTANFLQPFYRATLKTEGDHATIDRRLFTMDILIKRFEKYLVSCTISKLLQI